MGAHMLSVRCFALAVALCPGGACRSVAQEKPAPAAHRGSSPEAVQCMKSGVEAMRRRDWKAAEAAWEQTVKLEPENAGAWSNLGKVQLQQKELEAAKVSLEKAVALQPALAEAWMALGLAYDRTGAGLRAVSCLTRAAHESPADAGVRNSLAIVLKNEGWRDAAESELHKALDLDPRYAEAHFNLALMCLEHTPPLLEMAKRHYESARQLGAEPDKEVEAQLAGTPLMAESAPPDAPPKPLPKKPVSSKPTKPKP